MLTDINPQTAEQRIGSRLGFPIANFAAFFDGFSFTTETELQAYKAAYKYRYSSRTVVSEAKGVGAWLVQVWTETT